jgi:hypothetical protein
MVLLQYTHVAIGIETDIQKKYWVAGMHACTQIYTETVI